MKKRHCGTQDSNESHSNDLKPTSQSTTTSFKTCSTHQVCCTDRSSGQGTPEVLQTVRHASMGDAWESLRGHVEREARQRGERDSCMPVFCKHQEVIVVWLLIWSFNNTDSSCYIKTFAADAKNCTSGVKPEHTDMTYSHTQCDSHFSWMSLFLQTLSRIIVKNLLINHRKKDAAYRFRTCYIIITFLSFLQHQSKPVIIVCTCTGA